MSSNRTLHHKENILITHQIIQILNISEILLTSEARMVTYVSKQNVRSEHSLEEVLQTGESYLFSSIFQLVTFFLDGFYTILVALFMRTFLIGIFFITIFTMFFCRSYWYCQKTKIRERYNVQTHKYECQVRATDMDLESLKLSWNGIIIGSQFSCKKISISCPFPIQEIQFFRTEHVHNVIISLNMEYWNN